MTDRRVTEDTAITGPNVADGDLFDLVDVSDHTDAATGTNKSITAAELHKTVSTLYDATTHTPSLVADGSAVTVQVGVDFTSHGQLSAPPDGFEFNGHIFPTWFDPGEAHWDDAGWFAFDFDGNAHLWVAQHWGFGPDEGASLLTGSTKNQLNLFTVANQTEPVLQTWDENGALINQIGMIDPNGTGFQTDALTGPFPVDGVTWHATTIVQSGVPTSDSSIWQGIYTQWSESESRNTFSYIVSEAATKKDGSGSQIEWYMEIDGGGVGFDFGGGGTNVAYKPVEYVVTQGSTLARIQAGPSQSGSIFAVQAYSTAAFATGPTLFAVTTTGATLAVPLAMGSHKITGLTNGSASDDAAAFGQIATAISTHAGATDPHGDRAFATAADSTLSGTITTALALKAPLASPALTGSPTAPTQTAADNSTKLATTAYVDTADALKANLASPVFTGNPTGPTPGAGDNDTSLATTAYVTTELANARKRTVRVVLDGAGSAIATGAKKVYVTVPYTGTITSWQILADQSGSIVLDVWKDTYANYPPTVADTVTASAKPTLTAATKATSSTLTGWTTAITAGDIIEVNVDSASTVTKVYLDLFVTVT